MSSECETSCVTDPIDFSLCCRSCDHCVNEMTKSKNLVYGVLIDNLEWPFGNTQSNNRFSLHMYAAR
jgi:hypothetical protein